MLPSDCSFQSVVQLVKKVPSFHDTLSFIAVMKTICHRTSLNTGTYVCSSTHPFSKSVLSSHLRLYTAFQYFTLNFVFLSQTDSSPCKIFVSKPTPSCKNEHKAEVNRPVDFVLARTKPVLGALVIVHNCPWQATELRPRSCVQTRAANRFTTTSESFQARKSQFL
jgi:hypothetical protein